MKEEIEAHRARIVLSLTVLQGIGKVELRKILAALVPGTAESFQSPETVTCEYQKRLDLPTRPKSVMDVAWSKGGRIQQPLCELNQFTCLWLAGLPSRAVPPNGPSGCSLLSRNVSSLEAPTNRGHTVRGNRRDGDLGRRLPVPVRWLPQAASSFPAWRSELIRPLIGAHS